MGANSFDGPGDGLRYAYPHSHHDIPRCNCRGYPCAHHRQRSNTGSHTDANKCTDAHTRTYADSHPDSDTDTPAHAGATLSLFFGEC